MVDSNMVSKLLSRSNTFKELYEALRTVPPRPILFSRVWTNTPEIVLEYFDVLNEFTALHRSGAKLFSERGV